MIIIKNDIKRIKKKQLTLISVYKIPRKYIINMGICESTTKQRRNKTPAQTFKEKMNNSTSPSPSDATNVTNAPIYLSEKSKHDNIHKYYKINDIDVILGEGATGIVREATRLSDGKVLAIKTIDKTRIKYHNIIKNEIVISLMLNHENVIKCYEIFEDQIYVHFVLDYVKGGDLLNNIINTTNHRLSEHQSLQFLIQILKALDYMHNTLKICHRDIKPENILLNYDKDNNPILKIIDFGFACFIPESGYMTPKLGTVTYQAPEMLDGDKYDVKVDLWSTGVLLMNMITGAEPFSSHPNIPIEQQILNKPINFDKIKNQNLKVLAMDLLQRDPTHRIDAKTALDKAIKMALPDAELMEMEFKRLDDGGKGLITWEKILESYNRKETDDEHFDGVNELITYNNFCALFKARYIY